jgi:hypothetical protein
MKLLTAINEEVVNKPNYTLKIINNDNEENKKI